MKIALCQLDMPWEDKAAAKARILSLMDKLPARDRLDWVVFPEMTLSGFSMDKAKTTVDDSDLAFFADLARRRRTCVSFGGVQDGFNRLITMDESGKLVSSYSKIHLYSFGKEDGTYRPGSRPEKFSLRGLSVVPAVCFDLRFPYLFWNAAAQADLYVVIASWPMRRAEHWMRLLQARAIENQAYVVGVNRTGKDPLLEYSGNSMIFDPLGKVVLDCGTGEGVFLAEAEVDRALVEKTRTRFPFLKDRRRDAAFA
ncbi:MAG: carbon-nitrogen family hydrolase [Elusimicrobia bacterium]|nr:carbon-nitrogen family hydrolase [Elusimicrobiota bacterium]